METTFSEGQVIVGSDDRKIGRVAGEEDGCVLVQTGYVFKAMHAMPREFVHEISGELRATITKNIVESSPVVDTDWNPREVLLYYGIGGPYRVDPDPDGIDSAETAGERAGVEPAPSERMRQLGEQPQDEERPVDDARRHGNSGGYWPVTPRKD